MKKLITLILVGYLAACTIKTASAEVPSEKDALRRHYLAHSFRAVPQDSFPVLHQPKMGTVEDGDRVLNTGEWVIGIAWNGKAKAYPVDVMGFHELINDTVGGMPIAICW